MCICRWTEQSFFQQQIDFSAMINNGTDGAIGFKNLWAKYILHAHVDYVYNVMDFAIGQRL